MGSRVADLDGEQMLKVLAHPVQADAHGFIVALLDDLRGADGPADLMELHIDQIKALLEVQRDRGEATRMYKRLRRGRTARPAAFELAFNGDEDDVDAWLVEEIVRERVDRQLRSLGDAIAWHAFGFDRRVIQSLSRNQGSGPMYGKAGLAAELSRLEQLWDETGQVCLFHDATNCLNIGDITTVDPAGLSLIREVKTSGRATSRQIDRMATAVSAVNDHGPLPGSGARFVAVDVPLRTHSARLRRAGAMAAREGVGWADVPGTRLAIATDWRSMADLAGRVGVPTAISHYDSRRASALNRSTLATAEHRIRADTFDHASRWPRAVPFGIYPLAPELCADLICDLVRIEVYLDPAAVIEIGRWHGLTGSVRLPESNSQLAGNQPVIQLRRGANTITLHSAGLQYLLLELIDIDQFLAAIRELLDDQSVPPNVELIFDESGTWR